MWWSVFVSASLILTLDRIAALWAVLVLRSDLLCSSFSLRSREILNEYRRGLLHIVSCRVPGCSKEMWWSVFVSASLILTLDRIAALWAVLVLRSDLLCSSFSLRSREILNEYRRG
ncbi:unnamed protein product [Thelazia callipaeda]|uniref:Secreted protein n=1 Tax=Thelazia callipaeda TaxID=103827 RepID=A0A0N5D293_THECL|nr:unnamed protein product [Thelazia callipaeda]